MEKRTGDRTRCLEEWFAAGFSIGLSLGFVAALLEPRRADEEEKPATAARMGPSPDRAEHPTAKTWWSPDSGCRARITEFHTPAARPVVEKVAAAQSAAQESPVALPNGSGGSDQRHHGDRSLTSTPLGTRKRRRFSSTVAPSGRLEQGRTSRRNEGRWPLRRRSAR